ncbi:MAG: DUF4956 domain-containing protein [Roseburia sp.]|nr:DUF4956 domain-containing protein [Anaeroplasma bactoclasticum]MCM1196642.1 DUF4956 domain-containing protein [Roseburia sp.]MCM1557526.1 DUF4956 domain-containing protein [Anaeroplasma bactoclasticum]
MLDNIFKGLFDTNLQNVISVGDFLLCMGVALLIGLMLASTYAFKNRYTKSFLITLGIMPAIVCIVIMMVNGNIGAGVAVAGAFALVRFRSAPGTAKEITVLFLAMATGIVTGMGYLAYAVLFSLIMCIVLLLCQIIKFPKRKKQTADKTLRITIPEDLDYTNVFDDIFTQYTTEYKMIQVKTTNMGSMFRLTYNITEKDVMQEKAMIDALRLRNGNLEITISEQENKNDEL